MLRLRLRRASKARPFIFLGILGILPTATARPTIRTGTSGAQVGYRFCRQRSLSCRTDYEYSMNRLAWALLNHDQTCQEAERYIYPESKRLAKELSFWWYFMWPSRKNRRRYPKVEGLSDRKAFSEGATDRCRYAKHKVLAN